MDDQEYNALRIRASICPGLETEWPPTETSHGIALHRGRERDARSRQQSTGGDRRGRA